jgi:hypothetical protein
MGARDEPSAQIPALVSRKAALGTARANEGNAIMKRAMIVTALATVVFLAVCLQASASTVVIHTYSTPAAFKKALAGFPVKTVNFDGIKTGKKDLASFSPNKYRSSAGMIIKGQGGQYVSRAFRLPGDFKPVSKRNMYAPGPVAWTGLGGYLTDVTFSAGNAPVLAAGFGCYFIDADYPADGPASFTVYDAADAALGGTGVVVTTNAAHKFVGLVAVDSVSGLPVPTFARVHINSGQGWLGNNNNEGVALDNFMVGTATYSVSGKVVKRSGAPVKGATVTLSGVFKLTVKTNAKGRFTLVNVPAGTYTVKPTKKGSTFLPATRPAIVLAKNLALAKFVGK